MYTYANYSRPNSIVQAKLDNYKLNNNINLEKMISLFIHIRKF